MLECWIYRTPVWWPQLVTSIFKIYFLDAQASLLSSTYAGTSVRWLVGHTFFFRISILSASPSPHKSSRRHCGGRHGGGQVGRQGGWHGGRHGVRQKNLFLFLADMLLHMGAGMVSEMAADKKTKRNWPTWSCIWWPTLR